MNTSEGRKRVLVAAGVTALALVAAGPASASTAAVSYSGGWISIPGLTVSGDGADNDFTVVGSSGVYTIEDHAAGAALTAGSGCTQQATARVTCQGPVYPVTVHGGAGNDHVAVSVPSVSPVNWDNLNVYGDTGNDTLETSSSIKAGLSGDAGNDTLIGGTTGGDLLAGGPDADTLDSSHTATGAPADTVACYTGVDEAVVNANDSVSDCEDVTVVG